MSILAGDICREMSLILIDLLFVSSSKMDILISLIFRSPKVFKFLMHSDEMLL
jgi:hypothetical protein